MRKKVLSLTGLGILIFFGIGITTTILISKNNPIICDTETRAPYQYKHSPPYNETEISVWSMYIYSNSEIYWMFNSSNGLRMLAAMNGENYYKYEKLAYHRENGNIIFHDGQFLPYVEYYMITDIPSLYGEGYWKAPYLDWWFFVFLTSELKPANSYGVYSIGC